MTPLQKRRPVLLNHAFSALTLLVFAPGHSLSAAGLPEHHRILSCILEVWPHRPRAPSLSGKHNVSPGIDKYLLGTKRPLFQNHFTSHRYLLPGLLHHPSTWPSWCPPHTHTHTPRHHHGHSNPRWQWDLCMVFLFDMATKTHFNSPSIPVIPTRFFTPANVASFASCGLTISASSCPPLDLYFKLHLLW